MIDLDFTAAALVALDAVHDANPDAGGILEDLLDDIEAAPHGVRSVNYAPKGLLSLRAVPRQDAEVWVIWDWQRSAGKGAIALLGTRTLPRSR